MASGPTLAAEDALPDASKWQESFVGCSAAASPWFEQRVLPAAARPIMKIGDMQAWSVQNAAGEREIALTTQDGLTIYGRIVGPQGEDISGALLATVPAIAGDANALGTSISAQASSSVMTAASSLPSRTEPASGTPIGDIGTNASGLDVTQPEVGAPAPPPPSTFATPNMSAVQVGVPTASGATDKALASGNAPAASTDASARAAPSMAEMIQAALPSPVQNMDQLLAEATSFSAWFRLADAKPGAPSVYFFADPTCPYCAQAVRDLEPLIDRGEIDVRVILTPILSPDAFAQAVSIVQSGKAGEAFVQHGVGQHMSEGSLLNVLPREQFDDDVVAAMLRNVYWFRNNGLRGVPFWLYDTAEGAAHAQGPWDPAILERAMPLPLPGNSVASPAPTASVGEPISPAAPITSVDPVATARVPTQPLQVQQ